MDISQCCMHVAIDATQSMLSCIIRLLQRQNICVFSKTSRPAVGPTKSPVQRPQLFFAYGKVPGSVKTSHLL